MTRDSESDSTVTDIYTFLYLSPCKTDKTSMGPHAVELRKLAKRFGKIFVLKEIDLALPPGHFYALMGRNGAGKSTLMRILMRQETITSGYAALFGRDVESDPSDFNQDLGFVSENFDIQLPFPLSTFFRFYGRAFARWDATLLDEILTRMGIDRQRNFRALSRGQRMQVAAAAALAAQPRMLILDEITSVLDPDARAFFMDRLSRFVASGGTVLMASNILSEVQNHAEHLILLHDGEIKLNLPTQALKTEFTKLRGSPGADHPIFIDSACAEVGLNSDGSTSYLLPRSKDSDALDKLRDQRGITAEEVFVYLTRSRWK